MNEVTEMDRHLGTGVGAGSVHGPSQSGEKGFAPESTRPVHIATRRRERLLGHVHHCGLSRAVAVEQASRAARESPSRSERSEREYGVSWSAGRVPVTHLSSRRTDASPPRRTGPCLLRPFAGSILSDSGSRRLLSFGGSDCCPQFSQGSGCENLLYWGCNK